MSYFDIEYFFQIGKWVKIPKHSIQSKSRVLHVSTLKGIQSINDNSQNVYGNSTCWNTLIVIFWVESVAPPTMSSYIVFIEY